MYILIDNQRIIEVDHTKERSSAEEIEIVLGFDAAYQLLEAWVALDKSRRGYRYGGAEDDGSPDQVIIAWVDRDGHLVISDLDPFTDESYDQYNAYSLEDIAACLPAQMIQWGEDIGEEQP